MKKEYEGVTYEPSYQRNPDQLNQEDNKEKKDKRENKGRSNTKQERAKKQLNYNLETKDTFWNRNKYFILLAGVVIASLMIAFVTFQKVYQQKQGTENANNAATATETPTGRYNTKTQGVVKAIDKAKSTVLFYDIKEGMDYTVNYDPATNVLNKYDKVMIMDQLQIGEITDIYYDNNTNRLDKIQVSKEAWEYKGVKNLVVDQTKKQMSISNATYKYQDSVVIASEKNLISLMDLNQKDELIVKGYDKQIYSVIVDKGHGYIKLINYEDFVGGTVEVGHDIILPVVENMLIVAREGEYKLTMSNGNFVGAKSITVLRDQEVTVDMGDFVKPAEKKSSVDFKISPNGADLYVDGKATDYEEAVKLDYGEHQIEVSLTGYDTYTGKINVDSPSTSVAVDLVESKTEDNSSDKNNNSSSSTNNTNSNTNNTNTNNNSTSTNNNSTTTNNSSDNTNNTRNSSKNSTTDSSNNTSSNTSSNSNSTTTTSDSKVDSSHTVTVQGPSGAEVYIDGTLKGTAPVTFIKTIGTHTITIRKTGYSNKSYTVVILDDSENVLFNFPELTAQ
ncbi:PEGA domain-containing protein [Anaeromicropila herbilytica]|uniref:PEGA domain-containing protein n=1 Tax=Anaeromicropila herbilytica TaxID=2785025 RepID=A0A7R7EGI8_9FIRM|nr:PEGA domain-containing protein [Anaeromicropila herbilytica]BCN28780.1 hypothetical protein bsdtb5_00750 [Anaeromicropila herbilytica]